ncbi:MAG: glycosyltransferase, partial [Lachnospiraceae bacterium]|nr:glycosyltransferase [bacterium]MDY5517562.1 glycosyltransferase [Lachnospiraceae bacterium]
TKGYHQIEYIGKELRDIFAMSDVVVSRAGANSICELLALHKPNLLIPLSAAASRGDQILNAGSFEKQGFSMVLMEENLTTESLISSVEQLYADRDKYVEAMKASQQMDSIDMIVNLIQTIAR